MSANCRTFKEAIEIALRNELRRISEIIKSDNSTESDSDKEAHQVCNVKFGPDKEVKDRSFRDILDGVS